MRGAAAGCLLLLAVTGCGNARYEVDAIFRNAAYVVPGQDVRIAGARVGSIVSVRLTQDRRAVVRLAIDHRFAPFRVDAQCAIVPQSLLGDKYVDCQPGTSSATALRRADGRDRPTIPASRTSSPIDLDLVLSTFDLPTRERLALLLTELGASLAGRGDDLSALVRNAHPALRETDALLTVLNRERPQLEAAIAGTGAIVAPLAKHGRAMASLVTHAAVTSEAVARQRRALRLLLERLPALLDATRSSLLQVKALSRGGAAALDQLRSAAAPLRSTFAQLRSFGPAAARALPPLGRAAKSGTQSLRPASDVIDQLRRFASGARAPAAGLDNLLISSRDRGVIEGANSFFELAALSLARFDRYSHFVPAHSIQGPCQSYDAAPREGCSAHFGRVEQPESTRVRRQRGRPLPVPSAPIPDIPNLQPPPIDHLPALPNLPAIPVPRAEPPINELLDYLLR